MTANERIDAIVRESDLVLFMKGSRKAPQCGFSATVVEILDEYMPEYETVDVLADPDIREGIKEYGNWPTIPQLYVGGTLVGGCDIVRDMRDSGELDEVLGRKPMEVPEPVITLDGEATKAFVSHTEGEGKPSVRLSISSSFEYEMELDGAREGDIVVDTGEVVFVMGRATAKRADGLSIGWVEGQMGSGFKMDNPNEPPKVRPLEPSELKRWMDEGAPMEIVDVRTPEERETAHIEGTRLLDDGTVEHIDGLERDTKLVFYCHHGMRSQQAAQHFLRAGFREVYNLSGGIDAWSRDVDPDVPRY